ncbi:MAG: NADAR family protein [Planctomycetia bacterium]|nr:NADAR family protein [Planctomycetia bacterium]
MNALPEQGRPIDSFSGEYRWLSNFYPSAVELDRVVYASVEHAFQAAKTLDREERLTIQLSASAGRAKRLGRKVKLRKDWESVKVEVMRGLLRKKFADPDLGRMLLATGDSPLIEGNTWNDCFWGVCGGVGKNWLGRLLMEIRAEKRAAFAVTGANEE